MSPEYLTVIKIVVGVMVGVVLTAGNIALGYWMGRNSTDRPVRSPNNPGKKGRKAPIPEPAGDIFNTAAFGEPGEGDPDVSTLDEK